MARPIGKSKFPDDVRFCVMALWYHGLSKKNVAFHASKALGKYIDRQTVHSILVAGSGPNRSSMSIDDRSLFLDELKTNRTDGGVLPEHWFVPKVAGVRTMAPMAKKPPRQEPDLSKPGYEGRMKITRKTKREKCEANIQNNAAGTVEFFESGFVLDTVMGDGHSELRCMAAREFRNAWEGSQISPMATVDILKESFAGFGPVSPADHKITCMRLREYWKKSMPEDIWDLLEKSISQGEFIFYDNRNRLRRLVLKRIKYGLDIVSWLQGRLDGRKMFDQWPDYERWLQSQKLKPFIHNGKVVR